MNAIDIKSLKKVYANGTVALKGIDLQVKEGDFFALLGANGAGKTTIIGILTGLVKKTSGEAKVFGFDTASQSIMAKTTMGVVPQEMNFNLFEKCQDILLNQAGFYGIARETAMVTAEDLLKKLDLWGKRFSVSRSLSGGMKRRLMIARALINKPKLLILDEPTAGVDVELRHSMWEFIKDLNKNGTTVLLTTHYLEEVEQLCRNAAMIKNGEIIKYDRVKNLVGMVEEETYVVGVDNIHHLSQLGQYNPKIVEDNTFEVDIHKNHLNTFMADMSKVGMVVLDMRPKGNRMEKLFLSLLKD